MLKKRKYQVVFTLLINWVLFLNSCGSIDLDNSEEANLSTKNSRKTIGENLAVNPDFESGTIGWINSGTDGAVFVESNGRTGSRLTHYHDGSYIATTYQTVYGLENGIYKLSAYTVGGSSDIAYLFAEHFGGNHMHTNLPAVNWGNWKQYTVENIKVKNGRCTFGVYTENSQWTSIDNVVFEQVDESATSGDAIVI